MNLSKNMNPLVSICIPTYNGELYISEALASAINQTYSPLEIIVSDDNSSDKTLQIIHSFKEISNIPFTIYNHEPNGIGSNWNNCLLKAKGKYIKFLFQDDELLPECIERMVDLAESDPSVGIVFSNREVISSVHDERYFSWTKVNGNNARFWPNVQIISGKSLIKHLNLFNTPMNKLGEPTTTLIRKDLIEKIGTFKEDLKQLLDYEYWIRILNVTSVGLIKDKLVNFRLHAGQTTVVNTKYFQKSNNEAKRFYLYLYKSMFWSLNLHDKFIMLRKVLKFKFLNS